MSEWRMNTLEQGNEKKVAYLHLSFMLMFVAKMSCNLNNYYLELKSCLMQSGAIESLKSNRNIFILL